MPSIRSIILREQIRLLKPLITRMSIESSRSAQDKLGALGARAMSSKVKITPVVFSHFEGELIYPIADEEAQEIFLEDTVDIYQVEQIKQDVDLAEEKVLLYLHGGGYTAGGVEYARGFGSLLAVNTGRTVLTAAYRLAPEHPFPGALEDAYSAYQMLLKMGYASENIAFAGESAGGGLVFCLVHHLKALGEPLPEKIVSISPWADLTMQANSYRENEKKDPSLSKDSLAYYALLYGEDQLENPLVSPVFGDFEGFPPAVIFAGSKEMLVDDAYAVYERYEAVGAECHLYVEEGLWHVYLLFNIPEAKDALLKINRFLLGESLEEPICDPVQAKEKS